MKTLKIVGVVIITLVVVASTALFLIGFLKPRPGGIRIATQPSSQVFINGILVGTTPFSKTMDAGQISLRLSPIATASGQLLAYETKVTIVQGTETVVRREFGVDENSSSGDVVSFERIGGRDASLVVISTPDNAQVSLDGVPRGFSPYRTSSITPTAHKITVKSPGYIERTLSVNIVAGFQLTIYAKLGKGDGPELLPVVTPTPAPETKIFIEILKTPTGFLRVRTEPGTAGEEIAEVKPGEKYLFLDDDPATGWYKIQYQEPKPGLPNGIVGWVSNQYSQKVDEAGQPITSPSPTPGI